MDADKPLYNTSMIVSIFSLAAFSSFKCDSWALADTARFSVKQESRPSATSEKRHFHNNAQKYIYILKASASFYLNNC
jgi:hypothetical protein